MDDSGRKRQAMREGERVGKEKYEDMSHCTTPSFFVICHCSGLSLERKREMELLGGMRGQRERRRI